MDGKKFDFFYFLNIFIFKSNLVLMKKIILLFIILFTVSCSWNASNQDLVNIQEEKQKIEEEKKRLEEERRKIEEQKSTNKPEGTQSWEVIEENKTTTFIMKNENDFLNPSFVAWKIWWYYHVTDPVTEQKLYNAFLYSKTQDKDGLAWKVKVIMHLQNNWEKNFVSFSLTNNSFNGSYDPDYEPGFNIGKITVKFDNIPAKEYRIGFDIMESDWAQILTNTETEDFVQNLRKSKQTIIDFDFDYGGSGYYYFNTEWMDF